MTLIEAMETLRHNDRARIRRAEYRAAQREAPDQLRA